MTGMLPHQAAPAATQGKEFPVNSTITRLGSRIARRDNAKHPVRDLCIRVSVTLSLALSALVVPVAAWADGTPGPKIDVNKGTPDPTVRSAGDKVLGTFFYLIGLVGIFIFVKGVIKTGSDKAGGPRQVIVGIIVMLVGFVPGSILTGVVSFGNGLFN